MTQVLDFLGNLIARFSSRSFIVTFAVIFFIVQNPDLSVEQLVGLLGALGFITARAVSEDRVGGLPPLGTEIAPEEPKK